jgi:hypothetical protein
MARLKKIGVYLEIGKKRTFAGAVDWPGWCRSGRDEESALQSLFESGARFASVVQRSRLGFQKPKDASGFVVVERLKGNATTDFGAPAIAPDSDSKPVSPEELRRLESILKASWRALDRLAEKAKGKTLETGPRGGGRPLEKIIGHVLESSAGYLNQVGWKYKLDDRADQNKQYEQTFQASLDALRASARGEIPAKGPRGGVRWTARYFVRRLAWHILDHAWEIEDRIVAE